MRGEVVVKHNARIRGQKHGGEAMLNASGEQLGKMDACLQ